MDDETAYHLNFLESLNERKDYREDFSDNNELDDMLIFKQKAKNLLDMANRNRKNNDIDYYEYILKKIKARIEILNEGTPLPDQTPSPSPVRTPPRRIQNNVDRTPSPRHRSRSRTPPRVTRRRRSHSRSQMRSNQNNTIGRTPSPRQRSRSRTGSPLQRSRSRTGSPLQRSRTPPRITRRRRSQARRSRSRSRSIVGGKKN